MNTSDLENAIKHSLEKCNQFFDTSCPIPYQITNVRTYYPIDLLLDIYCEKRAFHTISPNRLFEKTEDVCGPSKSTLNKYYKFFKKDLKDFPNIPDHLNVLGSYEYAYNFLYKSINETENKIYTYNDIILGIIIGNWKYMPFNPRHFIASDRFGNPPIPRDKYSIFLKLNSTDDKNLSDDFDKLIYVYLTDRFFNINLFLYYVDFLTERGLSEDYEKRLNCITVPYFSFLMPSLKLLPSWYLKYLFWEEYEQNYQEIFTKNNLELQIEEMYALLEKTVIDIYNFSLVYYPMYKLLFKKYLYSELNVKDEDDALFDYIKNILSLESKNNVDSYYNLSIELNENIDFYLLTTLTKEFYSKYQVKFYPDYPQSNFFDNPDRIKALYKEIEQTVHNQMMQIRRK